MKKLFLFSFSLVFAAIFLSCSSSKSAYAANSDSLGKVFVTNTRRVDLMRTDSIKEEVDSYYYFEGIFGKQNLGATLYVQADSNGIDALLMNELGIQMGTITYDGKSAEIDSKVFPKKIKPEYLILDFQNAFGDKNILVEHYASYGLEMIVESDGQNENRHLFKGKKLVEEVNVTSDMIVIKNHVRKYEFKLTRAQDD